MPVVTDQERHRRVLEEDSKRKRDLAGYRRVEAGRQREKAGALRERMSLAGADRQRFSLAWLRLSVRLAASVPASTYMLWLGPLCPVGADDTTLFVAAPDDVREWTKRRYWALLREAAKTCGYTDVQFVSDCELGEGEACL